MNKKIKVESPGRINLIGEHVDYNGGSVLPGAIDKKVEFPFELTQEIVDKLLNRTDKNDVPFGMYN